MPFIHLSVWISAIIGVLIIAWIRSFDIYEKETFIAMLWAFLAGGVTSVMVALGIYEFLKIFGLDDAAVSTTLGSFLIIGPVEEFAKLTGLVVVYVLIKNQFNELTDGVIYMSCVALGFSIIENYFYANSGEGTQYLLVYRAFISTPAHISFSAIIGFAWYRHKRENKPFGSVIVALVVASLLHGIFDALAFSPYFNFLLLIYLYLVLRQTLRVVQYTNIISPFRPGFAALFENSAGEAVEKVECPYCGSAAPKELYRNRFFSACRCDSCGYHIASRNDIRKIFRIFAPEYKRLGRKLVPARFSDGRTMMSVYGSVFFASSGNPGFFRVTDLADRLQAINDELVNYFRKRSFISANLLKRLFD
ncbi:MAG: PrsW family intramembrane metalloprotease [Bacteroidales bacterium]|nr:PrsW family intramembrane metalloprotease [Bacteroidales bacterium]